MRLEQLSYLTAVALDGSLRRASERMHVSQPALSEAISRLERELGTTLLDRHRSGARLSRAGRDLLPHAKDVLDAAERLRAAAGAASRPRVIRVGTVNAATSTLLAPAVRAFRTEHPDTGVEVITTQQAEIHERLAEGSWDLGLVNALPGDDRPPDLDGTELLSGPPVVVLPHDHPLAARDRVTLDDLRETHLILMRAGYLMHRFVHRLLGDRMPATTSSTDGADMGKVMVADGLGVTVLPEFSVRGDPLERLGVLAYRPIAGDDTVVTLMLLTRRDRKPNQQVQTLYDGLVTQARRLSREDRVSPARPRPRSRPAAATP